MAVEIRPEFYIALDAFNTKIIHKVMLSNVVSKQHFHTQDFQLTDHEYHDLTNRFRLFALYNTRACAMTSKFVYTPFISSPKFTGRSTPTNK